jgi:serine/threonine-protein kinase RsbW
VTVDFIVPGSPLVAGLEGMAATRTWLQQNTLSLASGDPAGVPRARKHAGIVLTAWDIPGEVIENAQLAVSELVTNAQQAMKRAGMHGPLTLRLLADPRWLVVEVWDSAQKQLPRYRHPSSGALRGRGLDIVSQICHGWGYMHRCDGMKVVFAAFELE